MNGKKIGIAAMLLLMMAAVAPTALAATDFTMNWSGSGSVVGTFNSGNDAIAGIQTLGATSGQFYAKDYDDNPYTYNVDTTESWMRGDITGGGQLQFTYTRTDGQAGYGIAGQISNSFVGSTGNGTLDFRTGSNYASLVSSEYGFQSNGQFTAIGNDFTIYHSLTSGNPLNFGALQVVGVGSAIVDYMADGYSSGDGFRFGSGDGCYTNADILATGTGSAHVWGQGDSSLTAYDGSWTMPGGSYTSTWAYSNGLSVTNYAFSGN